MCNANVHGIDDFLELNTDNGLFPSLVLCTTLRPDAVMDIQEKAFSASASFLKIMMKKIS